MISAILRFWAIFLVAARRILAQRGLALATCLGLVAAVAVTMSIPLYSDAVYQNILRTEITTQAADNTGSYTRPTFAFLYRYVGSWAGVVSWDKLQPVDRYMSDQVSATLGLPRKVFVRYFTTDTFQLFSGQKTSYTIIDRPLEWFYFAMASDLEKHVTLTEGTFPKTTSQDSPIEVLVTQVMADKLGLQIGEIYNTFSQGDNGFFNKNEAFTIRVAGIWKATDPADKYWFYSLKSFENVIFMPEESFTTRLSPKLKNGGINLALWYMVMDDSVVHSADVATILGRITTSMHQSAALLPQIRLDVAPTEALLQYRQSAQWLTLFLYSFSIPILGMILLFIGLVVDMSVSQRQNEIAVLRSRGATILQVAGMALLEGLLLGLVSLAAGIPIAQVVAGFFGKTRSFLDFSAQSSLKIDITLSALQFGLGAMIISLVAQVLPTLGAGRHTIISYKQDQARQLRKPWWQRMWLDVILLIPAGYGIYLLGYPLLTGGYQQSTSIPLVGSVISRDPFQNPLLLLVPSLAILAVTLLIIRLLPYLTGLVARLAGFTKSVGFLLAARHLARTPGFYSAPMILLILTLSLSTFTASLAQTLDKNLHDQTYYRNGADVSVSEKGQQVDANGNPVQPGANPQTTQWFFLPVSEHLKVPGVLAAARVADTPIEIKTGSSTIQAAFIGVDRVDFPQTAYWRRDFASLPLGYLMNDLARTGEGVLVLRSFMEANALRPGDSLQIIAYPFGVNKDLTMTIVGTFDYFPTWYPDQGPLIVGNLDYFFEQVGGEFPYDVWLKTDPKADYPTLINAVRELYMHLSNEKVSPLELIAEQARPERQGFFGLLSVGFVSLALLTVLGFLLYALFSFRRRFIELGMLRAVGLSSFQMIVFLASELAVLILVGLGAGTGLGIWVSNLFIPSLQVGDTVAARIPPFIVQIDWGSVFQIYILFGFLFFAALSVLTAMLLRMKIFQAVKLGEAV
jgi:putative ABC transport system permease protein